MHEAYQRSADIHYARSVPAPEEASRASDYASAFVTSQLRGGVEYLPCVVFEARHSDCVSLTCMSPHPTHAD